MPNRPSVQDFLCIDGPDISPYPIWLEQIERWGSHLLLARLVLVVDIVGRHESASLTEPQDSGPVSDHNIAADDNLLEGK